MATDLTTFDFTSGSDLAQDLNDSLINTGDVNTLGGRDTLEGTATTTGIINTTDSTINTSVGDDSITSSSVFSGGEIGDGI